MVIGLSKYQNASFQQLLSPARDAIALSDALTNPESCAIPTTQVVTATNNRASKVTLISELNLLAGNADESEVIIVYFAGHGIQLGGNFYLCPFDANMDAPEQTMISGTDLSSIFGSTRARGVLLILDCCTSASFAECAPDFFRELHGSDFRILLSASRAGQAALERTNGSGTSFTKYLLSAILGRTHIGSTPGLVFFSDLLEHIQIGIAEDIEVEGLHLAQQPLFAGVFPKDPLIFVHKRLSLSQIEFKTARYSPAYVARMRWLLMSRLAGAICFVFLFFYLAIDKSQYISTEGDNISIYNGIPRVNVLGYPKLLWIFDISTSEVLADSQLSSDQYVTSFLGEPILPKFQNYLSQLGQARIARWSGNKYRAKELARSILSNSESSSDLAEAANLLCSYCKESDQKTLVEMSSSLNYDVRIQAIRRLILVNPEIGFELAVSRRPAKTILGPTFPGWWESAILFRLCCLPSAAQKKYFHHLALLSGKLSISQSMIEVALRNGIEIPGDDLASMYKGLFKFPHADEGTAEYLASYSIISGSGPKLLTLVKESLYHPGSDIDLERALKVSEFMHDPSLVSDIRKCTENSNSSIKKLAAYVNRRIGPGQTLRAERSRITILELKALLGLLSEPLASNVKFQLENRIQYDTEDDLLRQMSELGDKESIKFLINVIEDRHAESVSRSQGVRFLREMDPKNKIVEKFLRTLPDDIRKEAIVWYCKMNPHSVFEGFIGRPREEDLWLLDEIVPSQSETRRLFGLLGKMNGEVRKKCAYFIASYCDVRYALMLMGSSDVQVRERACAGLVRNPLLSEIVAARPEKTGFPDGSWERLVEEYEFRRATWPKFGELPDWAENWRSKFRLIMAERSF